MVDNSEHYTETTVPFENKSRPTFTFPMYAVTIWDLPKSGGL